MKPLAAVVGLALLYSGCGCTEIGCSSHLQVLSAVDGVEEAEAVFEGQTTLRCRVGMTTPHCSGVRKPSGGVTFTFMAEPEAMQTVRLYEASGALIRELRTTPMIRIEQPNGEDCEPSCKVASVTL